MTRDGAYALAAKWAWSVHEESPTIAFQQWESWTPRTRYEVAIILACQLPIDLVTTTDLRRAVDRVAGT